MGTSVGGEPDGAPVNHSSSLLRNGSSGGDHSSSSSLTAFDIMRMIRHPLSVWRCVKQIRQEGGVSHGAR